MSEPAPAAGLRFLYRTDEGTISRQQWWRGVAILACVLLAFAVGWSLLAPYANRGLDERQLLDALTITTYIYLCIYAFAILLIAVCFVNLSIKRLRARNLPTGLAGLLPLAALVTSAAHWLQPRVADVMPGWSVTLCDIGLLAVIVWSIVELGVREPRAT
jgi:uncharacterized membrane protein YhaH (DUF805 family)